MLVNLAGGTVLDEKTTEDTETTHPKNLATIRRQQQTLQLSAMPRSALQRARSYLGSIPGHTGVLGTLPLTETSVSANSSGSSQLSGAGTGVHSDGLADDEAILDELADGLAGVGIGDLADLVRVEPDLALSAADNGRRKALLRAEIDPRGNECQ